MSDAPSVYVCDNCTYVGANVRHCCVDAPGRLVGKPKPTGFDMPDPPRAHRIEVDRCWSCPFANGVSSSCVHPAVTERTAGRALSDSFSEASLFGHYNTGTPTWCPLRGAVTMIAGPPRFEKKDPTE